MQCRQTSYVDREAVGGGSASSANWASGQNELRRKTRQFRLPPGFFVAGQFGHVRKMFGQTRIPGFQNREQFVTNAIAREGEMAVGGVLAPRLSESAEIGFNVGSGGGEKRTENPALGKFEDRMDARETLCPCTSEEFRKDGLSLVVESVCGCDGIDFPTGQKLTEPGVAQAACGFFNGFGVGLGFGCGVDAGLMKRNIKVDGEGFREREIGIGFFAAQAVMEMSGVQNNAEFPAPLMMTVSESTQ